MRPMKLTMHAFGPYRDTTVIDFSKLGDGLFLVMGSNGAGKTMIFDAITYALFGRTSGSRREPQSLQSDLCKGSGDRTWVELEFSHNGMEYRVRREPPQQVPKRDGTMKPVPATAELFRGSTCLGTKKKDVDDAIGDILGMDADQWGQISMLAQGEFMKLLDSTSKERTEILRDLFDTGRYSDLQATLAQAAKEKKTLVDSRRMEMDDAMKGIAGEEIDFSSMTRDEAQQRLDEALERDQAIVDEAERVRAKAEADHTAAVEEKAVADEVAKKFMEMDNCRRTAEMLGLQKDEIDGKRGIRQKIERSAPLAGMMGTLKEHREELDRAVRENNECSARRAHVLEQLEAMKSELEKVQDMEARAAVLSSDADAIGGTLDRYAEADGLAETVDRTRERIDAVRKQLAASSERRSELEEICAGLEEALTGREDLIRVITELRAGNDAVSKDADRLEALAERCESLIRSEAELNGILEELARADRWASESSARHEQAESLFMRAQAGLLAGTLAEGVPCPVCGSVHHPSPASLPDGTPSEEEVRRLRTERDSAAEGRGRLSEQAASARASLEAGLAEASAGTGASGGASEQAAAARQLLEDARMNAMRIGDELRFREGELMLMDTKSAELEKSRDEARMLSVEAERLSMTERDLSETLASSQARLESLRESLRFGSSQEAQESAMRMRSESEALRMQASGIRDRESDLSKEAEVLRSRVETSGADVDRLTPMVSQDILSIGIKMRECGLSMIEYDSLSSYDPEALDREIADYDSKLGYAVRRAGELEAELDGRGMPDMEAIQQRLEAAEASRTQAVRAHSEASIRLADNRKAVNELIPAWNRLDEAKAQWEQIELLSDVANGRLQGSRKVQFEQYIQTIFFDEVLERANDRLDAMSGGRFVLRRSEGDGDMRSQSALDIDVLDNYTGRVRGVKSLSGGESFKAALSLALGLSDTVQLTAGGNRVEALFIDEGFGSLDADSLEQAVHVLEGLTEGDVMVGVISHVDALVQGIPKRIMVERDRETGSHVRIVTD